MEMQLALLYAMFCWLTSVEGTLKMESEDAKVCLFKSETGVLGFDVLGPEYILKTPSISISCRMSDTTPLSSPTITWLKLGRKFESTLNLAKLAKDTASSDKRSLESKLTVDKPLYDSISAYLCMGKSGNQTVNGTAAFMSPPLLGLSPVSGGVIADFMGDNPDILVEPNVAAAVTCDILGYPVSNVSWLRVDSSGKETPVADGPRLVFNKTSYATDRGLYICRAENVEGKNSLKIFLRVKNQNAFVIPLVITVCMVVVLGVIISVYEFFKWQKQKEQEGSAGLSYDDNEPANI